MLIMPYAHDQADNAWRAHRLGVARVIARGRYRSRVVVASWGGYSSTQRLSSLPPALRERFLRSGAPSLPRI